MHASPTSPPAPVPILRRLAIVCVSLLALFALGELGTRLWLLDGASDAAFLRFASIVELQTTNRFPALVVRHSYLGYVLQPGYAKDDNRINALGYRGEEFPRAKPAGELRIACIGASTTYGGGLSDYREAYPAQLEAELHRRGHAAVRVVNAGVSGYTSWESLANYLFRVSDLEPDVVVVYHGVNDIIARTVRPPEAYRADNSAYRSPSSQVYWPAPYEYSDLLRTISIAAGWSEPHRNLDRMFGGHGAAFVPYRSLDDDALSALLAANPPVYFERNLTRLGRAARDDGVATLFLTFAHCTGFPDDPSSSGAAFQRAYAEMNERVRAAAAASAARCYDLAADYPDDARLFIDAVHMTAAGNARMAGLVADELERSGWLTDRE